MLIYMEPSAGIANNIYQITRTHTQVYALYVSVIYIQRYTGLGRGRVKEAIFTQKRMQRVTNREERRSKQESHRERVTEGGRVTERGKVT